MTAVLVPVWRRYFRWIMALLLWAACLLWVYPLLWVLSASLKSPAEIFSAGLSLLPQVFQWGNYARAWNDAHFGTYTLNSAIVTAGTVLVVVLRSALAGYVLGRYRFIGRTVVLAVLIGTLFVPQGFTVIPVVQLTDALGLGNSLAGVILALGAGGNVAATLLYMGFFAQIPKEMSEAAEVDGAGFFTTFFRVMLPLAGPVTATVVVLTFISAWNAFFLPLVLTLSRPDLRTLSVGMLAFQGEHSTDWSAMAAAAVIAILPVTILFLALQRMFFNGIAGAVKS